MKNLNGDLCIKSHMLSCIVIDVCSIDGIMGYGIYYDVMDFPIESQFLRCYAYRTNGSSKEECMH